MVVASPTELLPALRNALIALAQDRGVTRSLQNVSVARPGKR